MTENVTPESLLAVIEAEEASIHETIVSVSTDIAVARDRIKLMRERLRELARMKPRKARAKKTD